MRRLYSHLITAGFGLGLLLATPAQASGLQAVAATAGGALSAPPTSADAPAVRRATGMAEIPDPELATMRGRYTVGDHQVAWFGVSMISTWQTASGQTLEGTLLLGMDFSQGGRPVVSFTPTVNITAVDAPVTGSDGIARGVDASGLANVSGMTQSVQVAGDGNIAANVTRLNVRAGDAPAAAAASAPGNATSRVGDAVASAAFDGGSANVLLQVQGQGAVQQWIRNGSLGQSIQLTSDHQQVSNRMEIDLVRQSLASNAQLAQNVAQAIQMTRGIGPGGY
nr:hypothetical protein [Lysobacter avium]